MCPLRLLLVSGFICHAAALSLQNAVSSSWPVPLNNGKLQLRAHIEVFCPGCVEWVQEELRPVYNDTELYNNLFVDIAWYGNAHMFRNHTVKCQHGENECYGNRVLTCAQKKMRHREYMDLVFCTSEKVYNMMIEAEKQREEQEEKEAKGETRDSERNDKAEKGESEEDRAVQKRTVQKTKMLNFRQLFESGVTSRGILAECDAPQEMMDCGAVDNEEGQRLYHEAALKTYESRHEYTPWISMVTQHPLDIFGWYKGFKHTEEVESDLKSYICNNLQGKKPESCNANAASKEFGACSEDHPCLYRKFGKEYKTTV